ncbi:MAG: hypothetical protein AB8B91_25730, partial [Rubripirellula sp.]
VAQVVGGEGNNTWTLTGQNKGTVNTFKFSGFENLTGGDQNDVFVLSPGASVSGKIDGAGGTDTLNYSG